MRKQDIFTLETKHEIKFYEEETKAHEIASTMNLAHTTAGTITKDEERILAEVKNIHPMNM